uniref:Uncharacterized protein n=1 Tax=Acrobeloides nanus TaxID=290746 RepID=A0A914CUW8_9BILA
MVITEDIMNKTIMDITEDTMEDIMNTASHNSMNIAIMEDIMEDLMKDIMVVTEDTMGIIKPSTRHFKRLMETFSWT